MKQANIKSKPVRMPRGNSDYGLVRRVARQLNVSESWVSAVKNGAEHSEEVSLALDTERKKIRQRRRDLLREQLANV